MNLGLSHFAYSTELREDTYKLLEKYDLSYVESVIPKVFLKYNVPKEDLYAYKKELSLHRLVPYSIQSLFYETPCTTLLNKSETVNHFKTLIYLASTLGSKILVLGSPALRKKEKRYLQGLKEIFNEIDILLNGTGIKLVIEPNARTYGGEFFHNLTSIIEFLKENQYINIRTMLDTHNCVLENLDPVLEYSKHFDYIKHIHISETDLRPITCSDLHSDLSTNLKNSGYKGGITYEVKQCDNLEKSLELFTYYYK